MRIAERKGVRKKAPTEELQNGGDAFAGGFLIRPASPHHEAGAFFKGRGDGVHCTNNKADFASFAGGMETYDNWPSSAMCCLSTLQPESN